MIVGIVASEHNTVAAVVALALVAAGSYVFAFAAVLVVDGACPTFY